MEGVQTPQAFSQLLDRGLQTSVTLATWCPTMDLLALLTTDGQLQLYRLNWQRLWSVTPESPISSVCWRPDGKQLAIGQTDGYVLLLNAEDGETQETAKIFETALVALTWRHSSVKTAPGNPLIPYEDRARRFFDPPLPPAPPHSLPTSAQFKHYKERLGDRSNGSWAPKLDVLGLLGCGSAAGEVALCGEGLLLLAKIPVVIGGSIHQLAMRGDLTELAVRWREGEENKGGAERLTMVDISSILRPDNQHALRMLCSYAADISQSLQTCRNVAWQMWKEWITVKTAMAEFKNTLDGLLKQHGVESNPQADLLLLVTMGEYTQPMEQFLMSAMGEPGLKKVARTVDASLSAIHALLVDRLQPEIEMFAFRLGELRGLAASPLKRKVLGLHCREVGASERSALGLVSQMEQFRDRLTVGAAQYRTFFSWLITALRRFPDDTVDTMMGYPLSHVDIVRAFLHTEFARSTLEPHLSTVGDPAECSPDRDLRLDAFDPGSYEDKPGFEHWKAGVEEEDDFFDSVVKLVQTQFDQEGMLDRGGWSEPLEALGVANGLLASGSGILQSINGMRQHVMRALIRPAAALSRAVREGPTPRNWKITDSLLLGFQGTSEGRMIPSGALNYTDDGALTLAVPCEVRNTPCLVSLSCRSSNSTTSDETTTRGDERVEVAVGVAALPAGVSVLDLGWYKNGALAVLLRKDDGPQLALVPNDAFERRNFTGRSLALDSGAPIVSLVGENGPLSAVLDFGEYRHRELPYKHIQLPLAVSATRGIGFVLTAQRRAILYDLEEDEEPEEEEEG